MKDMPKEIHLDYEEARKELSATASNARIAWTMEMKLLMAEFYGLVPPSNLTKLIGKTVGAISNKARGMGINYKDTAEERKLMMKKIRDGEIV